MTFDCKVLKKKIMPDYSVSEMEKWFRIICCWENKFSCKFFCLRSWFILYLSKVTEGNRNTTIKTYFLVYWAAKGEVKQNCDVRELRLWCPLWLSKAASLFFLGPEEPGERFRNNLKDYSTIILAYECSKWNPSSGYENFNTGYMRNEWS